MNGRVLVTGAGGYLGGRLVEHLTGAGVPLRLITRLPGSKLTTESQAADVELRHGSLLDPGFANEALTGVDTVVHLAAPNEIESEKTPLKAIEITIGGTHVLLGAAREAKVRRFVYLSTAHVYGPLEGRIDETSLPRPTHPYAITHKAAEDFVLAASRGGPQGVVIRLSNAIGAPVRMDVDRWTLLANDLCRQAVTTGKLVLKSAGLQRRDFVPMSDVCRAIEHLTLAPSVGDGLFQVGSGDALRVIDLAERIRDRAARLLGRAPIIERPAAKPDERHPDLVYAVDKLRATGFAFRGSLDAEIDGTLALCQRSLGTG